MKCVSGKILYDSEDLAKEALIQHLIRNNPREGSGPINIYQCMDCDHWHFTSKGEIAEFLKDESVQERIRKERQVDEWSRRF